MREDEIEALLKLDCAKLEVGETWNNPDTFTAIIHIPHDLATTSTTDPDNHYAFTGEGDTRQKAIAEVWQKYQKFMSTESGIRALHAANGQLMFRI